MSLPSTLEYGKVTGRFVTAVSDDGTAVRPTSGTVTFKPVGYGLVGGATPTTVTLHQVVCTIDNTTGVVTGPDGDPGVWLAAGWYDVTCQFPGYARATYQVEVTAEHTELDPLDLTISAPIVPTPAIQLVVNEQLYLDTVAARDAAEGFRDEAEVFAQGLHAPQHFTGGTDPIAPADIGAATAAHTHNASDVNAGTLNIARIPTGQTGTTVALGNDARFTNARTPTAHAASHADGGTDELDVADLGSGAAPAGRVPKSDGTGGVAWLAPSAANVFVTYWSTALNDYPAQPSTLEGCVMRWAVGPVQPSYSAIPGVLDHYTWADGAGLP